MKSVDTKTGSLHWVEQSFFCLDSFTLVFIASS